MVDFQAVTSIDEFWSHNLFPDSELFRLDRKYDWVEGRTVESQYVARRGTTEVKWSVSSNPPLQRRPSR